MSWCDGCILEESSGLPTGERIVATMGLHIQDHDPRLNYINIDPFTYEDILRDNALLSDYNWMFDKSESFEYTVNYLIVAHPIYISYLFQSMMMINVWPS